MATQPTAIELTLEQRRTLAELADRTGRSWQEVLTEALSAYGGRVSWRPQGERSFYDVLMEDGVIGVVQEELPRDLSTDPRHMEEFGRDRQNGAG